MWDPSTSISLNRISNRSLKFLVNSSSLICIEILWRAEVKDTHLSSKYMCPHLTLVLRETRYKKAEDARMALQQMEGFELAGRTVGSPISQATVWLHGLGISSFAWILCMRKERPSTLSKIPLMNLGVRFYHSVITPAHPTKGGNLNAASRQALMQKLARTDQPAPRTEPV